MKEKDATITENVLLQVLMHAKDATAIYKGAALTIVFANEAMLKFWGKDRKIIGKPLETAVPELSGQAFTELLKEVWQSGKTCNAKDTPAQLPINGKIQTLYFDFRYQALLDEKGHTEWILHTATEVTDRMKAWQMLSEKEELEKMVKEELATAHQELLASQHRIQQLVLSSPVGLTILRGKELRIEIPNENILKIWGRKREEVVGKKLMEVFPELADQPFPKMLTEVLATGNPLKMDEVSVDITDTDGTTRKIFIDFAYEPLMNATGEVDSVMATVTDISDGVAARKKLEENELRLQELNEELESSIEEYYATNEELSALNEEFIATNEELNSTNEEVNRLSEELALANASLRKENRDLEAATKKLFGLFEDAPVAIGLLRGSALIIESANPELLKLWGKDERVMETPLETAIPELKGQPFLALLDQVFTSGTAYVGMGQKATLVRNGKPAELYLNLTYKPIKDQRGNTYAIMLVANEVTDQIKAKQTVDEAYEQLQFALEVGNLGSYELDIATGAMKCNANFMRDFGLETEEELNLQRLLGLVLPDYRNRLAADIKKAVTYGNILEGEFQVLWPNGSRHWIKASGKAMYDQEGKTSKIVGMTENITEQKAFDQRKDDFLSIASHELKTPVTTLKANLQLLERIKDKLGNPMAEKMIETSLRNLDKLNVMVDNLLNINRFNEGQVKLEKAPFSLKEILDDCCGNVRLEGKHELVVSGEDVTVVADETRIDQVIANFVNNAVKYAPLSKEIYLNIEKLEKTVKVSVRDTGPGIPAAQLPNLFDRYWRADHSGKNYSGLGLGLFICAEIIRRHGGKIGVESQLGVGTTFWFTIPL